MPRKRWVYRPTKEDRIIAALHAQGLWPVMGAATKRGRERLRQALASQSITTLQEQLPQGPVPERIGANGDSKPVLTLGGGKRFVAVFLGQLEERAWPRFPENQWWTALRFADHEFE